MEALVEALREVLVALASAVGTALVAVIVAYIPRLCKILGKMTRAKIEERPRYVQFALNLIVRSMAKKHPDWPGGEKKMAALERAKEQFPWLPVKSLDQGIEEGWDMLMSGIMDQPGEEEMEEVK